MQNLECITWDRIRFLICVAVFSHKAKESILVQAPTVDLQGDGRESCVCTRGNRPEANKLATEGTPVD